MDIQFSYPVAINQKNGSEYQVALPDFPEASILSTSLEEALSKAGTCLTDAVSARIRRNQPVPQPSAPQDKGSHWAVLPAHLSAKTALYLAMRASGMSKVALAKRLNHDEKEIRRMLDPHHPSKLPRIEAALAALGMRLVVEMRHHV